MSLTTTELKRRAQAAHDLCAAIVVDGKSLVCRYTESNRRFHFTYAHLKVNDKQVTELIATFNARMRDS